MKLTIITGAVNGLTLNVNLSGPVEADKGAHFRIGRQAVFMQPHPPLGNEMPVTAVGIPGPEFQALGIRDDRSLVTYWASPPPVSHAVVWIVLGFLLLSVLVGIFFLIKGFGMYGHAKKMQAAFEEAKRLLNAAPTARA